jgi:F-type H+-transporting ATPase subunit gamma
VGIVLLGLVGQRYFASCPYPVLETFSFGGSMPDYSDVNDICDFVLSQFNAGLISSATIVYTHMYSTLRMDPVSLPLLPLDKEAMSRRTTVADEKYEDGEEDDFEYLPSPEIVFNQMAPLYVQGVMYGALVESFASVQCMRMTAMDTATDNAKDLLNTQTIEYHRARQSIITQELTEIVAGSAALE